ncbi:MAG: EAL domain-containing protein [Gammaproteobacteria bacterium]
MSWLGSEVALGALGAVAALLVPCAVAFGFMLRSLRLTRRSRALLERRYRHVLKHMDETLVVADRATGQILDANEASLRTLGYGIAELCEFPLRHIYLGLDLGEATEGAVHRCRMRARDGGLFEVELTVAQVVDEARQLVCIVGRDLSSRQQAEARLRASEERLTRVLESDELTGLASRAGFQCRLQERLASTEGLHLFHIDLDHFRSVNDVHGRDFGDQVLVAVARNLRAAFGPQVLLARLGADEFALACGGAGRNALRRQVHRIRKAVGRELTVGEHAVTLAASIGIAVYPQDGVNVEILQKRADMALYEAKDAGRDTCRRFVPDLAARLCEKFEIEQELRRAIDTPQIHVEYQPVIDLQTGLLVSFEALVRWDHPVLGSVAPERFVAAAEEGGSIVHLGERVVRDVVRQLRHWADEGALCVPVAVNVSPLQIERSAFSRFVHELLQQHRVDARWLSFEITESAWLQDSDRHIAAMDRLRSGGSRIFIDDFGTGFSNLAYLKSLPVDVLKIDRAFVCGMAGDANDAAIVESIIRMATQLRLRVVAEGVESAAIAEQLRAMGCHYGQGHYFSKPMRAEQCKALLVQLQATRRGVDRARPANQTSTAVTDLAVRHRLGSRRVTAVANEGG